MSNVVEIGVNDNVFQHELAAVAYEISVDEVSKVGIGVIGGEPGIDVTD